MSSKYRAELCRLAAKYARMFRVHESLVVLRNVHGEDEVHCPSRPDLPRWGMGNNSEDWKDGPTQDKPRWATRPPKVTIVSRRKNNA